LLEGRALAAWGCTVSFLRDSQDCLGTSPPSSLGFPRPTLSLAAPFPLPSRFMQMPFLPKLTEDQVWVDRKAPNTLVAHARMGNCIGDMGSYDYFSLGGPYR